MIILFRVPYRLVCSLTLFLVAFLDYVFRLALTGRGQSITARAEWLKYWSDQLLQILHVSVRFQGQPPARGMLVGNHLSYLDIMVLGMIRPLVFISKSEVASWPVAGRLTKCAGTLYLVRQQKDDVIRLGGEMVPVIEAGVVVTVFLEGTSTDGSKILPFRSPLLAPAEQHKWPVTPCWLHYSLRDGDAGQDVCYWGDMTFFYHFLKLLRKKHVEAFVSFGQPITEPMDRKEMARELHARVCKLKAEHLGEKEPVVSESEAGS